MKLAGMICKLDRFLENLQIVQCNLQIGQVGRLNGTVICTIPQFQARIVLNDRTSGHNGEIRPAYSRRG